MDLLTFPDLESLSSHAALEAAEQARGAIRLRGCFTLAASGGRTPGRLYRLLAAQPLEWGRTHLFWADERLVAPEDAQSNQRLVRESLVETAPIPEANVHPVPIQGDAGQAARDYEAHLRGFFTDLPRFDLLILGMGQDGHIASLFPGRPALDERTAWAVAEDRPGLAPLLPRVSLSLPVLENARLTLLLVTGQAKRDLLEQARSGRPELARLPVARFAPRGEWRVLWAPDEPGLIFARANV